MNDLSHAPTRTTRGFSPLYSLAIGFLVIALAGIAILVVWDAGHNLSFSGAHQRVGAVPLIMIGLSYITLQLGEPGGVDKIKGLLLGLAFVFWGSEQLLPPTRFVTIMDECVIGIFVLDVGWIIAGRINRHGLPHNDIL